MHLSSRFTNCSLYSAKFKAQGHCHQHYRHYPDSNWLHVMVDTECIEDPQSLRQLPTISPPYTSVLSVCGVVCLPGRGLMVTLLRKPLPFICPISLFADGSTWKVWKVSRNSEKSLRMTSCRADPSPPFLPLRPPHLHPIVLQPWKKENQSLSHFTPTKKWSIACLWPNKSLNTFSSWLTFPKPTPALRLSHVFLISLPAQAQPSDEGPIYVVSKHSKQKQTRQIRILLCFLLLFVGLDGLLQPQKSLPSYLVWARG